MRRIFRLMLVPIVLAHSVLVFSCSDSEPRIPFGAARVVINLNLPPETPAEQAGLIEKIRRFLVPDAVAQSAPAAFSNITVRVTGPDIALIEKSFAPYSTISLSVPAGALRIFEVTAYVAPGDPSAAASFRGTSSANCPAGATVSVPVVMGLNETKIVVPDFYNNRIVNINSMSGENWRTITSLPGIASLNPYDIDHDRTGRIYIANLGTPGVIRIDNLDGDNVISSSTEFGLINSVNTIAVDDTEGFVYYSTGSALHRAHLDGSNHEVIPLPTFPIQISYIQGIEASSSGNLYLAGQESAGQYRIFKCRVEGTTLTVIGTPLNDVNLINPWDVTIRGNSIYVINPDGTDNYKILRLIEDAGGSFQISEHYGIYGLTNVQGVFHRPYRFVAIRNDFLIITDSASTRARLVAIRDLNGSGWTTFGTYGPGVNQFRLWAFC